MQGKFPTNRLWTQDYYVVPPSFSDSVVPGFTQFNREVSTERLEKVWGRISYQSISKTNHINGIPIAEQVIKFICSPKINIPKGSHIVEEKGGRRTVFKCSGLPAVYDGLTYHQEVILEQVK